MASSKRNLGYRLAIIAGYLLASVYIFAMWILDTRQYINLNGYERARFIEMVYGTAYRPYVMRALVPFAVRLLRGLVPAGLEPFLQQDICARLPLLDKLMDYLKWEKAYLMEYAIGVVLLYASLLGFMMVLRRFARRLYEMDQRLADLLPIGAVLVLPIFFRRGTHYLYDFPALVLFLLGLLLLLERRWIWYYVVLILGLLNKETAILLVLPFVLHLSHKMERKRLIGHIALQMTIFLVIKLGLFLLFRDNPGTTFENNLRWNLRVSLRPYEYGALLDVLSIVLLVGYRFVQKPLFLRQSLWLLFPFFLSYVVGGLYSEIRVFYEIYPILFLLAFQTLAFIMGWEMRSRRCSELESGNL